MAKKSAPKGPSRRRVEVGDLEWKVANDGSAELVVRLDLSPEARGTLETAAAGVLFMPKHLEGAERTAAQAEARRTVMAQLATRAAREVNRAIADLERWDRGGDEPPGLHSHPWGENAAECAHYVVTLMRDLLEFGEHEDASERAVREIVVEVETMAKQHWAPTVARRAHSLRQELDSAVDRVDLYAGGDFDSPAARSLLEEQLARWDLNYFGVDAPTLEQFRAAAARWPEAKKTPGGSIGEIGEASILGSLLGMKREKFRDAMDKQRKRDAARLSKK